MEINGLVHTIGPIVNVSEKFQKREVIIKTDYDSDYPQYIKVQFANAKINIPDALRVGDEAKVKVNLRGKLYTNKQGFEDCFTTLEGWAVEVLARFDRGTNAQAESPQAEKETDDLPF